MPGYASPYVVLTGVNRLGKSRVFPQVRAGMLGRMWANVCVYRRVLGDVGREGEEEEEEPDCWSWATYLDLDLAA